jgi:hypothetical protein
MYFKHDFLAHSHEYVTIFKISNTIKMSRAIQSVF